MNCICESVMLRVLGIQLKVFFLDMENQHRKEKIFCQELLPLNQRVPGSPGRHLEFRTSKLLAWAVIHVLAVYNHRETLEKLSHRFILCASHMEFILVVYLKCTNFWWMFKSHCLSNNLNEPNCNSQSETQKCLLKLQIN